VARTKEIALAFPRGSHQEVFIEGILLYVEKKRCNWSYIIAPEWNAVSILQLQGWPGDGVIAAINTKKEAACAEFFPLPVVNMSSALTVSPVPRSMVDNRAIGVMAAEHLLNRGFHNLAYYGMTEIEYSKQRFEGFREHAAISGRECLKLNLHSTFQIYGNVWLQQQRDLTKWISKLPLPCGLFVVSDARARQAVNACQALKIRVPDQIAVVGVDDQQIICEHSHPTITSIARNNIREGYVAASLLDKLIRKKQLPKGDLLIPPLGIVARESTSSIPVSDERLAKVLSYFQDHLEEPVTVTELCSHGGVSRRWLEYAFRNKLGESPFNYMRRQRLEHGKRLLTDEPDTRIHSIARRTGYATGNQFAKAFRSAYGVSPRDYRHSTEK
jgi:LacI family transcriptional regulator